MNKFLAISLALFLYSTPLLSEELRLGVLAPLSGDFASYGESIQRGTQLAKEELEKQGIKIRLMYENACTPKEALNAIHKMIYIDRINAIAANFCVIAIPPIAKLLEENQIITFHTATASDSILQAGEFIFTTNATVKNEAKRLAEHAYHVLNARTASILYITTDFGEDYNRYFTKYFTKQGGKIISADTTAIGHNDFRSELNRIRAKDPDIIFAAHLGLTLGTLLRQTRDIGIKKQVLGVYEAEDSTVLSSARDAAEGLQFFTPTPKQETKEIKRFSKEFTHKFKSAPFILSRNAYDATRIIAQSMIQCRMNALCAKRQIYQIANYTGVSGTFSIESDGGTDKKFILKTVKNRQFIERSPRHE